MYHKLSTHVGYTTVSCSTFVVHGLCYLSPQGHFFVLRRSNKDVNCSLGDGLILEPVMIIVHGGDCGLVVLPPETINKVVLPSVLEQTLLKLRVLQDYCFPKYSSFVRRSRRSSGRTKQWNPAQKRFSVGNPLMKADWRGNAAIVLNR